MSAPPAVRRVPVTSFGAALRQPHFEDLTGLGIAMEGLDKVRQQPVYLGTTPSGGGPEPIEGYKANVSQATGDVYAIVSDKYQPVQDVEVFGPLYDALQALGIDPVGRIEGMRQKKTRAYILFGGEDFRVKLATGDILLGLRVQNSYGGDMSYGAEAFGLRVTCGNGMFVGELLGSFRFRHVGQDQAKDLTQFESIISVMLDNVGLLQEVEKKGLNTPVATVEVEDLLWSLNLGPVQVKTIKEDLVGWEPDIRTIGLSGWTLYNAVTAYVTYRENGARYLGSTEDLSKKALDLLTVSHATLLAKGKERREAYEEKQAERAESRRAVQVAAPQGVMR